MLDKIYLQYSLLSHLRQEEQYLHTLLHFLNLIDRNRFVVCVFEVSILERLKYQHVTHFYLYQFETRLVKA